MQWKRGHGTKFGALIWLISAGQFPTLAAPPGNLQPVDSRDTPSGQSIAAYDGVVRLVWPAPLGASGASSPQSIWVAEASLPLSGFVEVTRLDTGRTILAAIVARPESGRGAAGQLSAGAARQLQLVETGTAAFRVRQVNPPEADMAALMSGAGASPRLDTPPFLLSILRRQAAQLPMGKSNPQEITAAAVATPIVAASGARPATATPASSGQDRWFIQIAALSRADQAQRLAQAVGGDVTRMGALFRVRKGPYPTAQAARAALGPVTAKGYPDARITR